jgi:molecular chaperone DnaK
METLRFIGIDLGATSTSLATIGPGGRPEVIANRQGETISPSMVAFARQGDPVVGMAARRQALVNPRTAIGGIMRLLGRRWGDPAIERLRQTLPYDVVAAPNGDAWIDVFGRKLSPPEVAAHVYRSARQAAEDHLAAATPPAAVLTVPATFDQAQRQAMKDAAEIAGITVRRLVPAGAAAALGAGAHLLASARVVVCDFGGGKFDVTALAVEDGVIEVLASAGDAFLGGDDIDARVAGRLVAEIRASTGIDADADVVGLARLRDEVQKAKHVLSESPTAALLVPGILGADRPSYTRTLERGEVEAWSKDLLARMEAPCLEALAGAGLVAAQVDQLILAGGVTRMPVVQKKLAEIFGRVPQKNIQPDEVVALGAARYCALLSGFLPGVMVLGAAARTLGFAAEGGRYVPVIPRNATVPVRESRVVATTRDGQGELAIDVFEGESPELSRDRALGTFFLSGLPGGPAGEVLVLLDFTVDADGILWVSGREMATGVRTDVRLQPATGLLRADVRRLAQSRGGR